MQSSLKYVPLFTLHDFSLHPFFLTHPSQWHSPCIFSHSTEFSSIPHDFYFHTNQNLVLIIKIFFVGLPISNKGFEIKITGHDFYITFMYFVIINLSFGFLSATMKIIIPNPQVFLMTSKEDIAFKIPNIFSRGHVSL